MKKTEENLIDKLSGIVPWGIVITDNYGIIQEVNRKFLNILQHKKKEMVGKNIKTFFVVPTNAENFQTGGKINALRELHVDLIKKIGSKIPMVLLMSSAKNKKSGKKNFIYIFQDFDVSLDIEKEKSAVMEEKAKYEATLTSIGDALIAVDRQGKITLMNKVAEDILGFPGSKLAGKFIWNVFDIEDKKGNIISLGKNPVYLVFSTGKKITISSTEGYRFISSKAKFPIELTMSPIMLADQVVGGVLIFRDVTQEWQIDRAKTEFVSLASHQLRTPLTSINWYTEMLLNGDAGKLSQEQTDYLKDVVASSKRMVALVNSLLSVSRIELGMLNVAPEEIKIIDIAENVIDELKPQILEKEIKVVKNFSTTLPQILADPKLIRIIFQNLLSNAVKYTPNKGEITLTLKSEMNTICIQCSDTGYGIPKNQQSKIFSKLFRASNATAKVAEGTGLGLYIVKAIVEEFGGEISFESVENKGTTFYLSFPRITRRKEGSPLPENTG